jgi:hypothetical protein
VAVLPNGNQVHISIKPGPIKAEPLLGANYFDNKVYLTIANSSGSPLFDTKLGGDEFVTEAYLTALVTRAGKIVAGWVGFNYVADADGGIIANGSSVRQEGYFFASIFDPLNPAKLIKFQVNQNPEKNAGKTASCELSSGALAFVWSSNADGSGSGIYARIFDSQGNPLTDLAEQINAKRLTTSYDRTVTYNTSGKPLSQAEEVRLEDFRKQVFKALKKAQNEDISMSRFDK